MILAIDPGTTESAIVEWDGEEIGHHLILPNDEILDLLWNMGDGAQSKTLVIEQVASYGMPVGKTTFETVWWAGRFAQVWHSWGGNFEMIPRLPVKMHLCKSAKAKDSNIWQALIDRFGEPGKKANPGLLYPLKSHMRAAFALAVYYVDTH